MGDMAIGMHKDPETGVSYFTLREGVSVVRTEHVGDLTMVDLDDDGEPIGVEFAGARLPNSVGWDRLFDRFPQLRATGLAEFATSAPAPRDANQRAKATVDQIIGRWETDDEDDAPYTLHVVGSVSSSPHVIDSSVNETVSRIPGAREVQSQVG